MRRVIHAIGLISFGALLVFTGKSLYSYLYPEVLFPREDQIARILAAHLGVGDEDADVAICVVRRTFGRVSEDREFVRTISYFRALAKPWDPRGWLLDRRWPISAVRRYANGVVFSVSALRGACEWGFAKRRKLFLTPADVSLEFFSDCTHVPQQEKRILVKLVAVSPAIRNPYKRYEVARSSFGFFAAVEKVYPGGRVERSVSYYQSYILSQQLAKKYDYWRNPEKEIPERYWKDEFGSWANITKIAGQDEWWGEMVFPPPFG